MVTHFKATERYGRKVQKLNSRVVNIAVFYCNTQYCQYRFQYCQSIAILFENIYICIGIANTFSSIGKSSYYQYQYQ